MCKPLLNCLSFPFEPTRTPKHTHTQTGTSESAAGVRWALACFSGLQAQQPPPRAAAAAAAAQQPAVFGSDDGADGDAGDAA
jgi:hypothetical protein